MKMSGPEGHQLAQWLNPVGVNVAVLDYRLPKGRCKVPLLDAQQAIRILRSRSSEWGLDPEKIGTLGFSAGGHLSASIAVFDPLPELDFIPPGTHVSCRPDFVVLVYPLISMQDELTHSDSQMNLLGANPLLSQKQHFSLELQVNENTPHVFIAHAIDDKLVPIENSRNFAQAMKSNYRPVKLLEIKEGGHGLNGYKGPNWDTWQEECLKWLKENNYLSDFAQ